MPGPRTFGAEIGRGLSFPGLLAKPRLCICRAARSEEVGPELPPGYSQVDLRCLLCAGVRAGHPDLWRCRDPGLPWEAGPALDAGDCSRCASRRPTASSTMPAGGLGGRSNEEQARHGRVPEWLAGLRCQCWFLRRRPGLGGDARGRRARGRGSAACGAPGGRGKPGGRPGALGLSSAGPGRVWVGAGAPPPSGTGRPRITGPSGREMRRSSRHGVTPARFWIWASPGFASLWRGLLEKPFSLGRLWCTWRRDCRGPVGGSGAPRGCNGLPVGFGGLAFPCRDNVARRIVPSSASRDSTMVPGWGRSRRSAAGLRGWPGIGSSHRRACRAEVSNRAVRR